MVFRPFYVVPPHWGPASHAGYRSVTGTARLYGTSAWNAIHALIGGTFILA
ncbi:hypothetical protein [Niveispirillum sp. KHB5.9]|uniref:hypothetical protein n=1 Tax=Niveispirillum sp. KHB5.9 TaxID=3400269 RepID=UPI003A857B41